MFQKHWPALRGEFSQDFIRFAEKQLNLRIGQRDLIAFSGPAMTRSSVQRRNPPAGCGIGLEWPTRPWPGGEKYSHAVKMPDGSLEKNRVEFSSSWTMQSKSHRVAFRNGEVPAWVIPEPILPGAVEKASWNAVAV